MKRIVLAGGCFWGVEAYFKRFDGILGTEVGYANGITEEPTYEDVCSGITGHAEVVDIRYDEKVISLEDILEKFFSVIDPTILNRQGPDRGTQYRTGIYFIDCGDKEIINKFILEKQKKYEDLIVTEVYPLKYYYPAEEYHQKYLTKNPNGYCHIKF